MTYLAVRGEANKSAILPQCGNLSQIEVGNSYTIKLLLHYAETQNISLIISDDYSDTSLPSLTYSDYSKLDTIVCKLNTPPTLPATFSDAQYVGLTVICPSKSLAIYRTTDVWKDFWCLKDGAESYSTTDINAIATDSAKPTTIYTIDGKRIDAPQRGLNIVKYSDGMTKKIFVK